jgi:hypothetical protein
METKKDYRKYVIIAKVERDKFVKYRTNNIEKTIAFIKQKYGNCLFANIFYKRGTNKGLQFASYGKNKGLVLY